MNIRISANGVLFAKVELVLATEKPIRKINIPMIINMVFNISFFMILWVVFSFYNFMSLRKD